jgi:hypothetical protein
MWKKMLASGISGIKSIMVLVIFLGLFAKLAWFLPVAKLE